MESIMTLETPPLAIQAQPHPTHRARSNESGKPLTRVTLAPGPPAVAPANVKHPRQQQQQQQHLTSIPPTTNNALPLPPHILPPTVVAVAATAATITTTPIGGTHETLSTPSTEVMDAQPIPKRKPGRPKGTTKKGAESKGASKSGSRAGSATDSIPIPIPISSLEQAIAASQQAVGPSYSSNQNALSVQRPPMLSAAIRAQSLIKSESSTPPSMGMYSGAGEPSTVGMPNRRPSGRPRKDGLPTIGRAARGKVGTSTPPPPPLPAASTTAGGSEYVYGRPAQQSTSRQPADPTSSSRANQADPELDADPVRSSKPPGKGKKAMPGKKVGRPKANRDPAIMLKELLEKQEREKRERDEANRKKVEMEMKGENEREVEMEMESQNQDSTLNGSGPRMEVNAGGVLPERIREDDSRFYPPSASTSSANTSTSASPPTPGNNYLNPYAAPAVYSQPPTSQAVVGDGTGEASGQFSYSEETHSQHIVVSEWYPPHEKGGDELPTDEPTSQSFPYSDYSSLDGATVLRGSHGQEVQQAVPPSYPLAHPHLGTLEEQDLYGQPTQRLAARGLGLLQDPYSNSPTAPGPLHAEVNANLEDAQEVLVYPQHGEASNTSTPTQPWTPPRSKIELVASIVGTLIDLFPIPPQLNAAIQSTFIQHANETLARSSHDYYSSFYTTSRTIHLPHSDPYFTHNFWNQASGEISQDDASYHRFIFWDPLALSWSRGDGLQCPACQEGLLEHHGLHEKVMRVFDVPVSDPPLEEHQYDPKAFYTIGARYQCSSTVECPKRQWASWDPELCASLPASVQALSPIEQIFDLDGTLDAEEGCVGGYGLSRSLWRVFHASSAIMANGGVMDKDTCLNFLGTLFDVTYEGVMDLPSGGAFPQEGCAEVDAATDAAYNQPSTESSWAGGVDISPEIYAHHRLDAVQYGATMQNPDALYAEQGSPSGSPPNHPTYEGAAVYEVTGSNHYGALTSAIYVAAPTAPTGPITTDNTHPQTYDDSQHEVGYYIPNQMTGASDVQAVDFQMTEDIRASSDDRTSISSDVRGLNDSGIDSGHTSFPDQHQQQAVSAGISGIESEPSASDVQSSPSLNRGSPLLSLNSSMPSRPTTTHPPTLTQFTLPAPSVTRSAGATPPLHSGSMCCNERAGLPPCSLIPAKRPLGTQTAASDSYTLSHGLPKRMRHCCKCGGQDCKGKGGHTFCVRPCRDCGDPKCKGRNSRKPDRLCTEGWS